MSFNALFGCFYAFLLRSIIREKLSRFPFLILIFYPCKSAYSSR
ncbi:hypothetical protein HPCU_02195 [Helicobacter pylori Cuz20]|uniref:Uncharacterized protein n=1 Tax=Helicobacter pylori (strain Cuz20) TaxID=765964 RepID=A0AB32X7J1_HELPC|nr:hypothetical protein HPCU_02195 [Helicobacter pylori Cuz20]